MKDYIYNLDFNEYYIIYETLHKMMKNRNYYNDKELNYKQYIAKYTADLAEYYEINDDDLFLENMSLIFQSKDTSDKIYVFFYILEKLAQEQICIILHKLKNKIYLISY